MATLMVSTHINFTKGLHMASEPLLIQMAEKMMALNARLDAQQAVLVAVIAALANSSKTGGAQIEKMALHASENLCRMQEQRGALPAQTDQVRKHVETILLTVRAAASRRKAQ